MQTKGLALAAILLCAGSPFARAQSAPDPAAPDPAAFAATAASANLFEIESSQLALDQATSDAVKAFARQMIDDHTAAGEKMKAAAQSDGVTPPAAMAAKDQTALEMLQAANAEVFDTAYLTAQVAAHDEAVALFETFSEGGAASALKSFAAETLPTLEKHQAMAHELAGQD